MMSMHSSYYSSSLNCRHLFFRTSLHSCLLVGDYVCDLSYKLLLPFHTPGSRGRNLQATRCVLGGKSRVKAVTLFLTPPFSPTPNEAKGSRPCCPPISTRWQLHVHEDVHSCTSHTLEKSEDFFHFCRAIAPL